MLNKLLSGRFITLALDSIIYPGCVVACGILCINGKIQSETFIAILAGYALLVKETRKSYFDRTDRANKQGAEDDKK